MKNFLLKTLLKLVRPFIRNHPVRNRFLVVATTALGDTLWATPAIENLRRSFPNAYIALLTRPIGLQIFKNNPHVNKIHLLGSFFRLRKTLYNEAFDTIFLLHASQRLTLPLCALLGAKQIIGTAGINKGLDSLLTHPLPNHAQHEIVRRCKIIETIGAKTTTETLSLALDETLPPRPPGPWIALHPGSKDAFKRWPYFAALGKLLKAALPCEILITGTAEEFPLMQQIAAQIPNAHLDDPNRPIRQFAALLNQMDLLISNDTGPVHLACALNRPVIAIYSSTDPALCGPHKAKEALAISRRASCDPCLKRKCRLPFCFQRIGPEEVLTAAVQKLREHSG